MAAQEERKAVASELLGRCIRAFVDAGTLDLSLDQLADRVGSSKRMLIHYFGGREAIERRAMHRLEDDLRARFSPDSFPAKSSGRKVVLALWGKTIAPEMRGVLLLVMDVSRRAWSGSAAARSFYAAQQRLWNELLLKFMADKKTVEDILVIFQGAILTFLITGDAEPGRRALVRVLSR